MFLAYATLRGGTFLDRALYLPDAWSNDTARRAEAGVPDTVRGATKGALAQGMLARGLAAGVPAAWVVGDTIGGGDEMRQWLEAREQHYVLSVPCTHRIWTVGRQVEVQMLADDVPEEAWARVSAGGGSQGPRWYDWTCFFLPYAATAGHAHWLLVRRSVSDPTERAYYRVYAPGDTPTDQIVRVAGQRWCIESAFAEAKGLVGLDQYEVRKWDAWHRHPAPRAPALALLAHAALVVTRTQAAEAAEAAEKGGC